MCISDQDLEPFPQPFATALFSFLYHLASYESGECSWGVVHQFVLTAKLRSSAATIAQLVAEKNLPVHRRKKIVRKQTELWDSRSVRKFVPARLVNTYCVDCNAVATNFGETNEVSLNSVGDNKKPGKCEFERCREDWERIAVNSPHMTQPVERSHFLCRVSPMFKSHSGVR